MSYQERAMRTKGEYEGKEDQLVCASMGLSGESGEFIDIIKKGKYQGHTLPVETLVLELGDIAWYIALACDALGVTFDEVLEKNIEKLKKRYPAKFSSEQSIERVI